MPFNPNKLKVHLRLGISRLKLKQQKKAAANKRTCREIAELLKNGKEESARIKVEGVIREDSIMEAMEMLENNCEILLERFELIENFDRKCDPGIEESVNTLIYAAPRSEVKDLGAVRDQLISRYGKEFAIQAIENKNDCVNDRVVEKLKVLAPEPYLVNRYLEEIAKSYKVDWTPDSLDEPDTTFDLLITDDNIAVADSKPQSESPAESEKSDTASNDENPPDISALSPADYKALTNSLTELREQLRLFVKKDSKDSPPTGKKNQDDPNDSNSSLPPKSSSSANDLPDFDELTRRFEELKRK